MCLTVCGVCACQGVNYICILFVDIYIHIECRIMFCVIYIFICKSLSCRVRLLTMRLRVGIRVRSPHQTYNKYVAIYRMNYVSMVCCKVKATQ